MARFVSRQVKRLFILRILVEFLAPPEISREIRNLRFFHVLFHLIHCLTSRRRMDLHSEVMAAYLNKLQVNYMS